MTPLHLARTLATTLALTGTLLLCAAQPAQAQALSRFSCEQFVHMNQRSAQLNAQGMSAPDIVRTLMPASPALSDELTIVLAIAYSVQRSKEGRTPGDWGKLQVYCLNNPANFIEPHNGLCTSFRNLIQHAAQQRTSNQSNAQSASIVTLLLNAYFQSWEARGDDVTLLTRSLLEPVLQRELNLVFTHPEKTPAQLKADLEQRCMLR